MSGKLTCLVVFVMTLGLADSTSADLLVYWPFEDGSGTTVTDAAGNGHDGTIQGDPKWVGGLYGGALEFDGVDDYVLHTLPSARNYDNFTVALWVKAGGLGQGQYASTFSTYNAASSGFQIDTDTGNPGNYRTNKSGPAGPEFGPVTLEWVHLALVAEGTTLQYYYNGTWASTTDVYTAGDLLFITFKIGASRNNNSHFHGAVDDLRVYDHAMTEAEIQAVMNNEAGQGFPLARAPSPEDGSLLESTWANLTWSPGDLAVSHDVYIGENFDDVNQGAEGTSIGNQTTDSIVVGFPGFAFPDGLVPGTTYYWRIDEVNDVDPNSPWKGPVWGFSVPPKNAYNLSPADGARLVDPDVTLSWTSGFAAKLHHVYFGDNFDDVNDGAPATFKGAGTETTFAPNTLEASKAYYWRIDEFDGTVSHKGSILSFETFPNFQIPMTDPNLVGWWKLDEGAASVAVIDSSGYGHHGDIIGNSQWIDGYDGAALELVGGYVQMKDYKGVLGTHAFSVGMWVKTSNTALQQLLWWGTQSGGQRVEFRIHSNGHVRIGPGNGQVEGTTDVTDGQWHHVAATVVDNATNSSTDLRTYVDGRDDTQESTDTDGFNLTSGLDVAIGYRTSQGDRALQGSIDDVRIYDKVLTQTEIENIMRIDLSLAWNPSPRVGSTPDIINALPLSWSRGDNASGHDVYFGLDGAAIADADTSDATGVYRGRQNGLSFTPAEGVEWDGGPYYWRVDENNNDGTVTKGRIWNFSVADFILVDDFESYTDNDADNEAIWQHWIDGFGVTTNGAQVGYLLPPYAEQTIVNGGAQSIPLSYDNMAGVTNSQAELTLTSPRDWSAHDVDVLSVWFRGYPPAVGSFTEGPVGTYTMTAAGADIAGTADQFHFAYKTLTGPGSITARIDSILNTHDQAKAGVMIRETLDPNSAHALACITPANGVGSLGRTAAGGSSFSAYQADITAAHWVKLERDVAGNFTVSHSTNGSTWQAVELSVPTAIPMDGTAYAGLALTSHNAAETCEAKFSNVSIAGNVGGEWTHQDIGILGNASEPMYVAVTDGAGTSAVVAHDDADAATIDVWTEWVIDLQAISDQGVNLANVDKLAVGLGTRGNATAPGGSGTMFFDDIRLLRPAAEPQP